MEGVRLHGTEGPATTAVPVKEHRVQLVDLLDASLRNFRNKPDGIICLLLANTQRNDVIVHDTVRIIVRRLMCSQEDEGALKMAVVATMTGQLPVSLGIHQGANVRIGDGELLRHKLPHVKGPCTVAVREE